MSPSINFSNRQIRKGDQSAFKFMFDSLYDGLFGYAISFVNQHQAAEELVQEAFLAIWDRRKNIDDNFNIKAYLFKSVHNQALNYLHHIKIINQYVDESLLKKDLIYSENKANPFLTKALDDAIAELPERMSLIFKMSRLQGMRHREIAKELNITEKTVEVQIRKARLILQKKLKNFYNEL